MRYLPVGDSIIEPVAPQTAKPTRHDAPPFGFCTTRGQKAAKAAEATTAAAPDQFASQFGIFLRQLIELLAAAVSSFFIAGFRLYEFAVAQCTVCVCVCVHTEIIVGG